MKGDKLARKIEALADSCEARAEECRRRRDRSLPPQEGPRRVIEEETTEMLARSRVLGR